MLTEKPGRGFPATFGFVIAALCVIVVIQCLAVRDCRKAIKKGELEEGVVQTPKDEPGSEMDSKVPQVKVKTSAEIGGDDGERET